MEEVTDESSEAKLIALERKVSAMMEGRRLRRHESEWGGARFVAALSGLLFKSLL